MKRRQVIAVLGCAAVAHPLAAEAQRRTKPIVGFLHSASSGQVVDLLAAFRTGLKESDFSEDQNIAIEYGWADNDGERLPTLAASLVDQNVDVIAAAGGDLSAI